MSPKQVPSKPKALPIALIGVAVVGVGTVFYHIVEKLSYLDALYFSVITLTTIGYGDIVPKHQPARSLLSSMFSLALAC